MPRRGSLSVVGKTLVAVLISAALSIVWHSTGTAQQVLFFPERCPQILFFGLCPPSSTPFPPGIQASPALPGPRERGQPPVKEKHLFAEPQVGPDGQLRVYLPPKPVRDFLENPTPENAIAYREWNLERMQKVMAAQQVLEQINGAESKGAPEVRTGSRAVPTPALGLTPEPLAPPRQRDPSVARGRAEQLDGKTEIVYLLATWCPHCAKQSPILAAFARAHPDVRVLGIALDSDPATVAPYSAGLPFPVREGTDRDKELWGVRAFPTIVILRNGTPVRRIVGETSLPMLEAAVGVNAARR